MATTSPEGRSGRQRGLGRLLVLVYGVFALSASARAGVQILRDFGEAPVAYLLSLIAALTYIAATILLVKDSPTSRRAALFVCGFELTGVLVVGVLSLADTKLFPDASVWSDFGIGYGFVPLLLPIAALWWLRTRAGANLTAGDSA